MSDWVCYRIQLVVILLSLHHLNRHLWVSRPEMLCGGGWGGPCCQQMGSKDKRLTAAPAAAAHVQFMFC